MQQWWFDDGLGLKSVYVCCYYDISLIFKVFILYDGRDLQLFILVGWDRSVRLLLGPPGLN